MPWEDALTVMRHARERGVTFLDDARYDDETGQASLATGFSEVLFGKLLRATGWQPGEAVVANKLWWQFWPSQSSAEELQASLSRMELEQIDLIYTLPVPRELGVTAAVEQIAELLDAGLARAWGVANWTASRPVVTGPTLAMRHPRPS